MRCLAPQVRHPCAPIFCVVSVVSLPAPSPGLLAPSLAIPVLLAIAAMVRHGFECITTQMCNGALNRRWRRKVGFMTAALLFAGEACRHCDGSILRMSMKGGRLRSAHDPRHTCEYR